MDSKQNEHRHFRAQSVFISSLPSCFCAGYQTEMGPPSPNPTTGVWMGKEEEEQRKHSSHSSWEDFSFPESGSTHPWCTQGVSPQPGAPAAPLLSWPCGHSQENRPEHSFGTSDQFPEYFTLWWHKAQEHLSFPSSQKSSQPRQGCAHAPTGSSLSEELSFLAFLREAIPALHRSSTKTGLFFLFSSTNRWLWAELKRDL